MTQATANSFGFYAVVLALALSVLPFGAMAQESAILNISLKGHQFQPSELKVPAGKPIKIIVKNLDTTPAEFESNTLRVEKVVVAGGTISILVRPLQPGRYRFFDDFHPETEGYLVVQ